MLRKDNLSGEKLYSEVVRFFDDHKDFKAISVLFPKGFTYLSDVYEVKDSSRYFERLQQVIAAAQERSKVLVFLDPDTGIEPSSRAGNEHLLKSDIKAVCKHLRAGEKLIVYQHAPRKPGWQEDWIAKLTPIAMEMRTSLSAPYHEPDAAKDVCFFTFTKEDSHEAALC
jgi:hypothetical protein